MLKIVPSLPPPPLEISIMDLGDRTMRRTIPYVSEFIYSVREVGSIADITAFSTYAAFPQVSWDDLETLLKDAEASSDS